ncbi:hypothetical protein VKS41_008143 [Umbelopsis sp. WA50703]
MSEKKDNVQYSPLPMYEDVEAPPMHKKCRRRKMVKRLGLGAIVTLFALSQLSSSSSCWKGARQYFTGQEVENIELYYPEELAESNLPEPDSFVLEVADMFPHIPEFGNPVDGRRGFFHRGPPSPEGPPDHHHGRHHHGHGKHHGKHHWKHEHKKHRGKKHHEGDDEPEDDQEDFRTPAFDTSDENVDVYKWIDGDNLDEQADFTLEAESNDQPEEEQTFTILPFQPDDDVAQDDEEVIFENAMDITEEDDEEPEEPEKPSHPERPHHPGRPRHPGFPGRGPHGRRPHRGPHHGRCKNENLTSETTTLSFSPDQFKGASVILDGHLWGKVNVTQETSEDVASDEVKVEITILSSTEKLGKAVSISSFDHEGKYTVEVKGPHHPPPPPGRFRHHGFGRFPPSPPAMDMEEEPSDKPKHRPEPPCLKAHIKVIFPAGMKYYEDLDLHLRAAFVTSSLHGLTFGKFRAGVGRGRIHFDDLTGEELHIAAVRGLITGSYKVSKLFGAGTIGGASNITVTPTSNNVTIKAHAIKGVSSVKTSAKKYEGKFAVAALAGNPTVKAPNPADIHVTKLRPYLKAGYFKEQSDSAIVVSATHGIASLEFV